MWSRMGTEMIKTNSSCCRMCHSIFFIYIYNFVYLFLALLGLCSSAGGSLVVVQGLLTAVASLWW